MILFWVCAALLTAGAVLALTRPLIRGARAGAQREADLGTGANVAVYRDQLAEIDNDKARGLISEAEGEAARIEIARRLLASADAGAPALATGADKRAPKGSGGLAPESLFMVVAGAVPAIAIAVYMALGSPGMPGRPIAERLARTPTLATGVEELVARVEAQLRANPADGQGWEVIAPVYLRMERFADAAEAFRRALDLLGETPRRLSGFAESTVLANDGIVTEPARKAYERLIVLEPGRVEARFGLALAKEQEGDIDAAEAIYLKLIEEAPIGAPWRQFIGERVDAIAARRAGNAPAEPSSAGAGQRGGQVATPDPAAAASVAALPEDQRRQVILQMVEGLAAKLAANGRDREGWQRLIRAWSVLGETAKAEAAVVAARKALTGDAAALGEIDAFARSLGLKS